MTTEARTTRKLVDRHGTSATLTNYESTGEDDYGEMWAETADSPKTIPVVPGTRQQPGPDRDSYDAGSVTVDQVWLVEDTVDGIRDGGGEGASRLDVGGQTYVVFDVTTLAGAHHLYCTRGD